MEIIARRPIIFFSVADEAMYGPFWNNEHAILGIILNIFGPSTGPNNNGIVQYYGTPVHDKRSARLFGKRTFEPKHLTVGPGWISSVGLTPEENTKTVKTITWRGDQKPFYHSTTGVPPMMRELYTNK